MDQAASPKKRVIFDEDAYDADWWRETCAYYQSQEEEFWEPYDPNNPDPFLSSDFMQEDFDVAVSDLSSFFEGEHGGNHIIARGSIGRWDGVRHGMTPYDDLKAALDTSPSHSNTGNVFADCEIDKIWDENGRLFVTGAHHDGRVTVELRQLTDAGEEALKAIEDVWANGEFIVAGKIYDGSPQSVCEAMNDLWSNPGLAPLPRYMEQAFGCPAEEYEEPEEAREQESGYSLGSEQRDAAAAKDALGGGMQEHAVQAR